MKSQKNKYGRVTLGGHGAVGLSGIHDELRGGIGVGDVRREIGWQHVVE